MKPSSNLTELADDIEDVAEPGWLFLKSGQFFVALIFVQILLLIVGESYGVSKDAMMAYLLLVICIPGALIFYGGAKPKDIMPKHRNDPLTKAVFPGAPKTPFVIQLIYYGMGFGITFTIMLLLVYSGKIGVGEVTAGSAYGLILFQVCVVSVNETLIFHALIPKWVDNNFLKKSNQFRPIFRYTISQAVFAAFHLRAFEGNPELLGSSFVFGCLFLAVAEKMPGNLTTCMAVHAAWNIALIGIGTAPLLGA